MTITNRLLSETAKFFNDEVAITPNYFSVSTDTSLNSIDIAATSLSGESLPRLLMSKSRSVNEVTLSAVRLTVDASPGGDILRAVGGFSGPSTQDLLLGIMLPDITHTTSFDLEINGKLRVQR